MGGIAYTPYLPAKAGSPQESASTTAGSSSGSKSEKISGTMKAEIVDLLKQNGIPSDVSVFLKAADNFLTKSQSLSSYSIFGGENDDYDISDLIKIQELVNEVQYNKGLRDKAFEQVTKEAAGSEVAITSSGKIYALTEDGNFTTITPKEYAENEDNYQVLTNSQLMYYRENRPELAFKTDILDDLNSTIGMESITKYLRDTIKAFGKEIEEGYTTKSKAVNNGLKRLMEAGPDGYYLFTEESQIDKNDLNDINSALKYLYNGMSNNAKNLLKAKTAVEGGDPSDPNDISNLLLQALFEHTDTKQTVKFDKSASDYDPNQTGKKGGSSSENMVKDTYLYRVASLNGPRKQVMLAPKGSKIADTGLMITQGITNGAVIDSDGKRIGNMSVDMMLQKAEAVKAADASKIVLGKRVLRPGEYGGVMFDSNQECNTVYLPYTFDGGQMIPDFDVFEKYNQLQRAIAGKFDIPKTEVDRLARDLGLSTDDYNYDSSTNSLSLTKATYFLTFGAIVGSGTIDLTNDDKRFLTKLDPDEGEDYKKAYDNMIKYGSTTRKKSDLRIGNYDSSNKRQFYRGILYMAMPDAYRGAHLSMDEYIDRDSVNNFGRRTELREQQIAVQKAYEQEYGNFGQFTNE